MSSTQIDSPNWFDKEYVTQHFDVSDFSNSEVDDLYGFVDGLLNNRAEDPDQVLVSLEDEEYVDEVKEFANLVNEESLRYTFRGAKGSPDHIGRQLADHRKSRSYPSNRTNNLSRDSSRTKNPNPKNSSFSSGRNVNIDRLKKHGELSESVHHDVRDDQDEVMLILEGELENVHSDRIELTNSRYKDLTLEELVEEYGEPFEEIKSLKQGEIKSDGSFSSVSTVVYEDVVAE